MCAVACLISLQCCCGFSIDSSACLALLCSASLRDLLPSLLCYPFHTVTLKSVGVSIWSWIGGYLLAFCGIHHLPVSTSSSCWNMSFPPRWLVPVTLFLPMMILKSEISYSWSLGIFSDMNGVSFQVLYFIILPVALSFLGSLLSFWTFKTPLNPVLSKRLINCQTCMFESERNVLPIQYLATPRFLHWTSENYPFP